MTMFEVLKSKNIDELAEWIDKNGQFDNSPWLIWFDNTYCKNCETIMCHYAGSELMLRFSWCELNNKCKFFQDMDKVPSNKEIIKLWLETENN